MDNPRIPRYRIALVKETGVQVEYPRTVTEQVKAAAIFKEVSSEADREYLMVATLDAKNKVIGVNLVSIGTISSAIAANRDIFKLALLQNAAAIIVGHNHPSGSSQPSKQDLDMWEQLKEAGKIMNVSVLDSIILGDTKFYSLSDYMEREYARSDTSVSMVAG